MVMWFFLLSSVFAQEVQKDLSEVDFSVLEPIRHQDKNLEIKDSRKLQQIADYKRKVEMKTILESGKYLAVLKAGTFVENLEGTEIFKLSKDLNVYVYRTPDESHYKYVVNTKGEVKYKVQQAQVEDVTLVVDLKPKPEHFSEVENKIELTSHDKFTKFLTQYNFHSELFNSRYLQEVAEARYDNINRSLRAEAIGYLRWNFPIELGLSANYQTANVSTLYSANATFRSYNLGPVIRWHAFSWNNTEYRMHFSYQQSLGSTFAYQVADTLFVTVLSTQTAELGLEGFSPNKWGNLTYGINARRQWLSITANVDNYVLLGARSNTADSIGLYIGHDFEINL